MSGHNGQNGNNGQTRQTRQAMLDLMPLLRRYARSLTRSSHDAEDLLQDCLARAMENAAGWRGTNLRAWMTRIMTNLNYNRLRGNRRQPVHIDLDSAEQDGTLYMADMSAMAGLSAAHIALRRAVEKLPAEQRAVLMLVAIEGYAYGEAAEILEIPPGTVMSRLSRARSFLAAELARDAGDDASASNIVELRSPK